MSDLQLKVTLSAIDKITAPLRGIAKQSQRLSQGYKADMRGYNATLKQTEDALKNVRETQRKMVAAGNHNLGSTLKAEETLVKRINETNSAMERRKSIMDREMGAIRRRQAAMDRGKSQMMRGTMMTGAAAGATYAGARFMMPGFDFEEEMSKVQALTRLDKDDPMLTKLKEQAKELGAKTWASATQAAQGQSFYAMAGFKPQDIIDAMPATLDLARAGGIDVGRAADIGSNILQQFKLPADQMGRMADSLVATFTRTNVDMNMLADSMKFAGPVAQSLGMSLEETLAMVGMLGNIGIQGGDAGTAIRKIEQRLANPPKMAQKSLDVLDIKTKDEEGNLRNVADIFQDLFEKTKDLGTADRIMYLSTISGLEASAAMTEFASKEFIGSYENLHQEIKKAHELGEANAVALTMADNIKGDWEEFTSAIESVQIETAEAANGSLRETIQSITKIIEGIGLWIKANPKLAGTIFKVTAAIVGITAALGALSIAMAIFNMTVLANPIILLIGAIIVAVIALIYYKDEIWNFFKTFAEAPAFYIKKTLRYITTFINKISNWLKEIPLIGPALQLVFEAIATPLRVVIYLLGKITDAFAWIGNTWISPTIDTSNIKSVFDLIRGVIDFILDIRNSISDLIGEIPLIGSTLQFLFDLLSLPFVLLMQGIKKVIEGFEWIGANWERIKGWFINLWQAVTDAMQPVIDLFQSIINLINQMITGIKDAFSFEMPNWMKDTGHFLGSAYDAVTDGIGNAASGASDWVGEKTNAIFGRNNVPAIATTPAVPLRNVNTTNHQEIHVEVNATTNASPQAIAGAVANEVTRQQSFMGDRY